MVSTPLIGTHCNWSCSYILLAFELSLSHICRVPKADIDIGSLTSNQAAKMEFIQDLYSRPIAIEQEKANEQHYEVPTEFHLLCLGPRMKYSSCQWPSPQSSLVDAEDAILSRYCLEARLGRGLRGVGVDADPKGKGKASEEHPEEENDAKEGQQKQGCIGREGEGLKILDLGCGWGSLGLFLAEVSLSLSPRLCGWLIIEDLI